MGGTQLVREEPGKQRPRSCRAQELARSSARENERQKESGRLNRRGPVVGRGRGTAAAEQGKSHVLAKHALGSKKGLSVGGVVQERSSLSVRYAETVTRKCCHRRECYP